MLKTDVSTVTDETSHLSLQCPYITKRKNSGGKRKKLLHPVGETSVKKFSTCPPSTSSSTKWKCRQGEEGETMKKVSCFSRRSWMNSSGLLSIQWRRKRSHGKR